MSLHGGSVDLESVVGEGTTVTATFPKSRFVVPDPSEEIRWNVR
jgi:signal transduction histidine kinase